MLQCQYCNKEIKTIDKRKKFCDRKCYNAFHKNPSRYKPCEICRSLFYLNYSGRRFCSKECRLKSGWIEKRKWHIYICEWCNKEFNSWESRQNRFCSSQCRSEFGAQQPKTRKNSTVYVTKICEYCSKKYKLTLAYTKLRKSRFCSEQCRSNKMSIEMQGENNPNWNGGTVDQSAYGPNWERQKRKAKRRDNHTCQVCSYKSGGNRFLDVHHIIPIKTFDGDYKSANKLDNLISLCRTCHAKVEKDKISCPTHGLSHNP